MESICIALQAGSPASPRPPPAWLTSLWLAIALQVSCRDDPVTSYMHGHRDGSQTSPYAKRNAIAAILYGCSVGRQLPGQVSRACCPNRKSVPRLRRGKHGACHAPGVVPAPPPNSLKREVERDLRARFFGARNRVLDLGNTPSIFDICVARFICR